MKKSRGGNYPENWSDIALKVKEESDWCCVRCNQCHDVETGYVLTVHHLDMNPANCRWWNIPPLCQRCHLQIQNKVIMEQPYMFEHSEWFKPYVAGYYAFHNGHDDSREYVMNNLDSLLEYGRP